MKKPYFPKYPVAMLMACLSTMSYAGDQNLSFSGLVELEYTNGEDMSGANVSDISLATFELGIDARVNNFIKANVVLLEEEDDTDNQVDQAYLTYNHPSKPEVTFMAGRLYIPFGVFKSHTVSDPLTLELGEAQESALQLDYDAGDIDLSVYLFNGDSNEASASGDDNAEQFGFYIDYALKMKEVNLSARLGYISSIADSDGLSDGVTNVDALDRYVPGINFYLGYANGPIRANFEYLGANTDFDIAELAYKGEGAQPSAYLVDVGYESTVAGKPATFGISLQGTEDAVALGLPKERLTLSLNMDVLENTSLGFEWLQDDDYSTGDGGTGDSANMMTLQLAIEF